MDQHLQGQTVNLINQFLAQRMHGDLSLGRRFGNEHGAATITEKQSGGKLKEEPQEALEGAEAVHAG